MGIPHGSTERDCHSVYVAVKSFCQVETVCTRSVITCTDAGMAGGGVARRASLRGPTYRPRLQPYNFTARSASRLQKVRLLAASSRAYTTQEPFQCSLGEVRLALCPDFNFESVGPCFPGACLQSFPPYYVKALIVWAFASNHVAAP